MQQQTHCLASNCTGTQVRAVHPGHMQTAYKLTDATVVITLTSLIRTLLPLLTLATCYCCMHLRCFARVVAVTEALSTQQLDTSFTASFTQAAEQVTSIHLGTRALYTQLAGLLLACCEVGVSVRHVILLCAAIRLHHLTLFLVVCLCVSITMLCREGGQIEHW